MRKCTVLSGAILGRILGPNLLQMDFGGGNGIWIVIGNATKPHKSVLGRMGRLSGFFEKTIPFF